MSTIKLTGSIGQNFYVVPEIVTKVTQSNIINGGAKVTTKNGSCFHVKESPQTVKEKVGIGNE